MKINNFQMEYSFMRKRYVSLLETGKFSDCCFIIDGEKIQTHKLILASASPVFEAMLFGPLASSEIIVKDITTSDFKQMLTFIYSDNIELTSVQNTWSLVYTAKKYLITDMINYCLKYIKHELGAGNVILNYEYAAFYNEENIRNICLNNIKMYAKIIFSCDYHMKASTLCNLLEQNDFNLKEEELITLSLNWAKTECAMHDLEVKKENLRRVLIDAGVLSRLRFLCLSAEEMYDKLNEFLYDNEVDYLKLCKMKKSKENLHKLITLNFCVKTNPRNSIQLVEKKVKRRELKAGTVYCSTGTSKIVTQITASKCVLVSGFILPSRRPNIIGTGNCYMEHISVTITDVLSKCVLSNVVFREKATYNYDQVVKIQDPVIFEPFRKYNIEISLCSDHVKNEYLMYYFPSLLICKDVKFEFEEQYECGFIQGILYCSFA